METPYAEFLDNFERLLCEAPVEVATLPDLFLFIKKRKQELESSAATAETPSRNLRWYVNSRPARVSVGQAVLRWREATKMSMNESKQHVHRISQMYAGPVVPVSREHAIELYVAGFSVVDSDGISIALEVVSLPWILNQLAGMGFTEAYDFIKKGAVR